MDRWASCTGLLAFLAGILNFGGIILYQIFWWLADGRWRPVPLSATGLPLKSILSDWIGLQSLFDWFLQLPLSLIGLLLGVFVFWGFGVLSARLYDRQVRAKDLLGTPSQTHA